MNMGFYLLLRARRLPVAAHPVVKRLLQYRQLLQQLEPLEEVTSSQLEDLLNAAKSGTLPVVEDGVSDTKYVLFCSDVSCRVKLLYNIPIFYFFLMLRKKKKLRLLSLSKTPEPVATSLDSSKFEDTPDTKSSKPNVPFKKESKKHDDKMPWENDIDSSGGVQLIFIFFITIIFI